MVKISKKIIILALISLFLLLPIVKAQNDTNSYFESARDQLLSSCNSEIVSHSAIILGLIIAMATIGRDAIKAIVTKKLWKHFFGFGSIAFVVLLTLYESGRLFYYTDISQRLLSLNNDTLTQWLHNTAILRANVTAIPPANETYYTGLINRYSTNYTAQAPTSQFAQLLSPNHPFLIPSLMVVWTLLIFLSFVIYARVPPIKSPKLPQQFSILIIILTPLIFASYVIYSLIHNLLPILIAVWILSILISIIVIKRVRKRTRTG